MRRIQLLKKFYFLIFTHR